MRQQALSGSLVRFLPPGWKKENGSAFVTGSNLLAELNAGDLWYLVVQHQHRNDRLQVAPTRGLNPPVCRDWCLLLIADGVRPLRRTGEAFYYP